MLPGWIDTDLTKRARQQVTGLQDSVEQRTPHGRWGIPDDMAGIAAFLASPASDFVTGTAIPVDGGFFDRDVKTRLPPVLFLKTRAKKLFANWILAEPSASLERCHRLLPLCAALVLTAIETMRRSGPL